MHDNALFDALAAPGNATPASAIDAKTAALARVAATIAVDAAPHSFQHAIAHALAAGATSDEVVAILEAVTPVTGAARVVQGAPKVALAPEYPASSHFSTSRSLSNESISMSLFMSSARSAPKVFHAKFRAHGKIGNVPQPR